jgi:hypothetical protein
MASGWIAQGPATPVPVDTPVNDPWKPLGGPTPITSAAAIARPHQDPNAHPIANTQGLLGKTSDLLFGHEPENAKDPDQQHVAGIFPSIGDSVSDQASRLFAPGPDVSTLATAYPHLIGAQVDKIKAGYQETAGAAQVQSAEQAIAALNVLPQVAQRFPMPGGVGLDVESMAKDPAVQKTAIKLGLDPKVFAASYAQYAGMSPEEQADMMSRAKDTLEAGAENVTAGKGARAQAWADERVWQPTDLMHGKLDPWSLKGIAFNTALAIPELGMVVGATVAGTAAGSPALGMAAGGATAVALFAPAQRAEAKDKIDDQVSALLRKADALDEAAPIGGKRGLNPVTNEIRQQAADLAASSDKIANTAGVLYAVADAAGAVPVASVLSKSPVGKVMLDRMIGAAASKTVGGRIGGAMVANGAGGMLQASIQKAVDTGIVHEQTSLADALKDIAYTGIVSAITAAPIAGAHEAMAAPGRAQAQRKLDSDELLNRVKTASQNMGAPPKAASADTYPGYKYNQTTGKYEASETNTSGSETRPRIAATEGQVGATNAPEPETPAGGAPASRAAYQAKTQTLNEAAAAAEKRSDVSLQPEEEGWSVHVKGQAVAHFETAGAAQEAVAAARKLVGTKPASAQGSGNVNTSPSADLAQGTAQGPTQPAAQPQANQAPATGETPTQPASRGAAALESPTAPTQGPRTDMDLSPGERAAEREREAARRDAEEGVQLQHTPEVIPKRAAESEGEAARRDQETGLPGTGGTPAAAKVLGQPVERPAVPTPKQAEAGNYFKPTVQWHGLPIKVETAKGQVRKGIGADGKPFSRTMKADYGYLPGTKGADNDGVDVMMGPHKDAPNAFVIDQLDHTGKKFDEHKLQIGVRSEAEARAQYLSHYPKGWKGLGGITELGPNELKHWLKEGDLTRPIDPESVPREKAVRGAGPDPRHDSVLEFLARHPRGLDSEEAKAQGIDPADMALSHAHVGIKRAFRKGGMSFDHAAEALHEAGYPVDDAQGHYSPNALLDKIDSELRGKKVYSSRNEKAVDERAPDWRMPLSDAQLAKLTIKETTARLDALRAEQDRLEREIERAGLNESSEVESRDDLDAIPFQRGKAPGVQQDLFGDKVAVQNEIKRHEAALDKKRSSGQESVETGKPDDLFSQSRRQTELPMPAPFEPMDAMELNQLDRATLAEYHADAVKAGDDAAAKLSQKMLDDIDREKREFEERSEAAHPTVKNHPYLSLGGALEDAGAKIGGARKDRWAERGMRLSDLSEMTETEAAGLVTKKAVWNPKWGELITAGMPKDVAALGKVLIDQLGAKPRNNTPQGRRDYVQAMGLVRDFIEKAKNAADLQGLEGHLVKELGVPTGYAIASTPEQMRARDIFWSIQKGRRSTLRVAHSDLRKVRTMLEAGWPEKAAPVAPVDDGKPKEDKAGPKRPHLDRIERIGPPVRKGDVTSSDFINDFGFRGLEFGNWAANDERQRLMNHAYEGLHDLARAMGLPPKALALNGTMGLALGARGGGRFAAHYESGKLVINMTKINGAGALAHEWGHALDHYLGELDRPDAYTTDARGASGWYKDPGTRTLAHLRPEMQQAFGDVNKAMFKKTITAAEHVRDTELGIERAESQKRDIVEAMKERPDDTNLPHRLDWVNGRIETWKASRQRALDNPEGEFGSRNTKYLTDAARLGDYWRRPTEMFARAFEAFIFDKLKAQGQQSDYLVHGNEAETYAGNPKGNPYPAEDRPAINAAMQKLADTLEVHGEKHAIREMDLAPAGAETTHYAVREPPPPPPKASNLRPAAGVRQLDIFANAAAPAPASQAARLAQSVKLAHIGEFRSGIKQVKTWQDAAHILAPLRKNPQENMVALVVDKTGKPLAVIRHTIGVSDGASVEPWSLAGSIVQVPGASSVYFAHNHPSGVVSQSNADESITKKLHNLLKGSGILPRGMIVVGPNSRTASYFLPEMGSGIEAPIPAARRSGTVPMQERRYARLGGGPPELHGQTFKGGPDAAKRAILASGEKSGVMLSNQRHQIVGIVPMTREEMSKLRTGNTGHGAGRLLKAMAEGNANTLVTFGAHTAALNAAIFGNAAGARVLDVMHWDKDQLVSAAATGNMPHHQEEGFLQRGPGGAKGGMSVPEIRTTVDKFLQGFGTRPDVVIAKNLAELQADPVIGESLKDEKDGEVVGFFHPATGKIYLVADQLPSPGAVAATMAHEFVGHFGLRAAFGDANDARYQAILDGMRKAMPAEFRRLGALYFPKGFNPLNAHHRNVAAEEVLTHYGMRYVNDQSVPAQAKRWLDRLLALLRDWFRSAFGLSKRFDELFVKRTLADLESFLRRGRSGAKDGQRTETEPAFAHPQDTFFSGLAKAVDAAKRDKGTGAEWEATLKNMPGVKQEEMNWVGLKDWLDGRGRVSKEEVAEFVHAHTVQIGEVQHGGVVQRGLNEDELGQLNERMAEQGYGDIEGDQAEALKRGGPDTEHMLEELHRMGVSVKDMMSPTGPQAVIEQLSKMGYQVHEDDVTGSPYLMSMDEHGTAHEVADGDVPDNVRELLSSLREGPLSPPKYPQWATPGGENYRELLMTLPQEVRPSPTYGRIEALPNGKFRVDAPGLQTSLHDTRLAAYERTVELGRRFAAPNPDDYRSQHWDEANVLAHIRFDDRTGPNGEKILHVHEIQSDWHQAGRRQGYATPMSEARKAEIYSKIAVLQKEMMDESGVPDHGVGSGWWHAQVVEINMLKDELEAGQHSHVPDAPFKTTWPELAVKRMLRYAAERGYDSLSWDTGDTNAERYNMQQVADKIHVTPIGNDSYNLIARKGSTTVAEHNDLSEKKLADLIGKDMAQRAITRRDEGVTTFTGEDLKIGGKGMRGFYDDILPNTINKLVKKWGSSVEPMTLPGAEPDMTKTGWESTEGRGGHAELPVHSVVITPAMRDSVMAGQPMFLKRRKGSTGTPAPAPKKGAYALARRAIAAIPNNEFTMALRRIADPAGVSEASKATAIVTREALGELAQASEEALKSLEQYSKQFDLLSIPDRYEFIDAMEGGKPTRPDLQPAADAIRKLLDGWRENIRGLGVGALDNFIENYFPHIWQRDDKAKKIFGQIFGRRPLKGPASFLKERTVPNTREGLDAGLVPISSNPLVLAFAKLREMQRFYTGVKLMQRYKDEGLAKFLPSGKLRPDDWAEIDDAVGRVRQWSEAEQGFIERGRYIMPTDAARVINNHLSASALRNFLPAQVFRSLSNAANALQLGFSAFHLGFTTLDAIISKNALAIERLAHGEPLKAAQALLEGILGGPVWNIRRGSQLLKAYSNIGGATPEMRRIVEGLMAAGGRIKMDNYYQAAQGLSPFKGVGVATLAHDVKAALTQPYGKVQAATQVLTSFPQQYAQRLWRDLQEVWRLEPLKILPIMSALEIAGRMTRASTSIIMEHIVPLQKLGVFSDLAADHIRRNPLEDPVAFADAMQKIWNSVDNRLGEMVYDNVFWNRTFKDVNHMMVRAVGWNLGTVRELGGAPIDVIKLLDYMARGAPAEITGAPLGKTSQARLDYEAQKSKFRRVADKVGHKIPYTLALIATTMILGAVLTRLFTGKSPEDLKDYFFPPTGRKTKYGTPERISMPSYTKDMYEYATQPMTTVINKANPIFGIAHSIYANEDFYGNAVRTPDDSWEKQTWDSILYGARQVLPFSLQGGKQFAGAGVLDAKGKTLTAMPYVGFGPAPARVTSPEQMERYQLRETEKSYIRGLQRRFKDASQKGDKEAVERLREEIRTLKLKERGTEHDIRQDKEKAQEAADKISSLIEGRSREEAAAALIQAGMPAFAQLWRSLPEHPKPRVAQSLEEFA